METFLQSYRRFTYASSNNDSGENVINGMSRKKKDVLARSFLNMTHKENSSPDSGCLSSNGSQFKINPPNESKLQSIKLGCKLCSRQFNQGSDLRSHILKMHTSTLHSKNSLADKPCQCTMCPRSFRQAINLEVHMKVHRNEKPFECDPCGRKFIQKNNLFVHIQKMHMNRATYKCTQCKRTYDRYLSYRKHLQRHAQRKRRKVNLLQQSHNTKPLRETNAIAKKRWYKCEMCARSFPYSSWLNNHMKVHSVNGKSYHCKICNRSHGNSAQLREHMKRHNADYPFQCQYCSHSFRLLIALRKHLRILHASENFLECKDCGQLFIHLKDLHRHLIKIHATSSNRRECIICDKAFSSDSYLRRHLKYHLEENLYKCHLCEQVVASAYILKKHLTNHFENASKSYECFICARAFRKFALLKAHLSIHDTPKIENSNHGDGTDKKLNAGIFLRRSLRARKTLHFLDHFCYLDSRSPEIRTRFSIRTYKCPLCKQPFTYKCNLRRHMKRNLCSSTKFQKCQSALQQSVKNSNFFQCFVCDKLLANRTSLGNHLSIHTGEKRFACIICGHRWIKKYNLEVHMRTKHGIKRF